MALLALTSPSKGMDERTDWTAELSIEPTQPRHLERATELVAHLREQSQEALQDILDVSDDLTALNYQRYQEWQEAHTQETAKPALLLYAGQVYKMIDEQAFSAAQQRHAQESIRIISGLYGLLRPYDLIQPYRLEMKTPLDYVGSQSLAAYWEDDITSTLAADAAAQEVEAVLNLASNEYANAVDASTLPVPMIDVAFKEERDGGLRTIAIYAKQARGAMLEYIVEHEVTTVAALEEFDGMDYSLQERTDDSLLFTRES